MEAIYYKTPKDSETGEKFQEIAERADLCQESVKLLLNELGASSQYYPDRWSVYGGIEYVIFDKEPDMTVWKSESKIGINVYSPRLKSKAGKDLESEIGLLPKVSRYELNQCIGFDSHFHCIGFTYNDDLFGFSVSSNWKCKIPTDCEEITYSEYQSIK